MPSPYTPTPTPLPATIDVPDDGDLEDASSVNVPSETALDAIANLELPQTDPSESPPIASRSLNMSEHGHVWFDPTEWGQVTAKPSAVQLNGTATYISMDLSFPHGCTVTEFYIYVTPSGFHGGLPATPPSWVIYERDMTTGADTPLDSKADPYTGGLGGYEVYHFIGHHVTVPFVVDRAKRYWVVMNGEGGANAQAGLVFEGATAVATVTSIDVGAS